MTDDVTMVDGLTPSGLTNFLEKARCSQAIQACFMMERGWATLTPVERHMFQSIASNLAHIITQPKMASVPSVWNNIALDAKAMAISLSPNNKIELYSPPGLKEHADRLKAQTEAGPISVKPPMPKATHGDL